MLKIGGKLVKNIYFAFHFENDFSRAAQISKIWEAKFNKKVGGFFPPSLWDAVERKGEDAIKNMIKRTEKYVSYGILNWRQNIKKTLGEL